ncbi:Flp family type IVb pilin [Caballeronia sp. SEWSISQ10-4 2]|uniref:Flp family type IVb pilin n=1 Tax=Caballeronia sp. SEWSISQ10-4 2 TaxID=2937438 RepID=UPI002655F1C2|nr:Flp family type IVb pilin [Caballeronia sp. SEWSISQ10-4 2]MDN7183093.1 Flp family type IVb pilin [Caballeronia sp. SEWSISQ10-4 2]
MQSLINGTKAFIRDEDGVTAIEYGLIAAVISAMIIASFGPLSAALGLKFDGIAAAVAAA